MLFHVPAAAAFTPQAVERYTINEGGGPLYSLYCSEPTGSTTDVPADQVTCKELGYNYTDESLPQAVWYTKALESTNGVPILTGVYFDQGGGDIWMESLAVSSTQFGWRLKSVHKA